MKKDRLEGICPEHKKIVLRAVRYSVINFGSLSPELRQTLAQGMKIDRRIHAEQQDSQPKKER